MFRALVMWLSRLRITRWVANHGPGHRVARRFVAGETLEEGIEAARELNAAGIGAMLDLLGENVESREQAFAATDAYIAILKRIRDDDLADANISIKLTQLGLDIGEDLCEENAERVLEAAGGMLVMIDMEAHGYVEATLRVLRRLWRRHENVGVCIQAYLRRTGDDVGMLAELGCPVRVCKGAYLEPEEIAYAKRAEVSAGYARAVASLLEAGNEVHIATHDPKQIEAAARLIRERRIPRERFEFQMLYGIRKDLQQRLSKEGHPVRVYIPYGQEWYPYLTRRLAERPANLWFFLRALLRWKR